MVRPRRLRLTAALLMVALTSATAAAAGSPARFWLGPALALDPAFVAAAGGADWFFSPELGAGVAIASTWPGAGDRTAVESGYRFASLLARLRLQAPVLDVELSGGGGLAEIRFGSPGLHTELAPDLAVGAAVGWPLSAHLALAVELTTHVTFGAATAARNPAHTSELLVVALRLSP
jgi:hypothetical protein